jgi:hypothetical protein
VPSCEIYTHSLQPAVLLFLPFPPGDHSGGPLPSFSCPSYVPLRLLYILFSPLSPNPNASYSTLHLPLMRPFLPSVLRPLCLLRRFVRSFLSLRFPFDSVRSGSVRFGLVRLFDLIYASSFSRSTMTLPFPARSNVVSRIRLGCRERTSWESPRCSDRPGEGAVRAGGLPSCSSPGPFASGSSQPIQAFAIVSSASSSQAPFLVRSFAPSNSPLVLSSFLAFYDVYSRPLPNHYNRPPRKGIS